MDKALLDTDILSEVLKGRHPQVVARAEACLSAPHRADCISVVSVMEVVSGLQRMARWEQLERFLQALGELEVLPLERESAVLAGRIDEDLWRVGQRIGRADPMVAAQAIVHGVGVGDGECASLCACGGGRLPVACGELAGGGVEAVLTIDPTRGHQARLDLVAVRWARQLGAFDGE
jgi:tRNA(fMet)-specific endonuclease VapC